MQNPAIHAYASWSGVYGGLDPRSKYYLKSFAGGLPIIGPMLQASDNVRYMDDYLRNRGMTYDQIKYPMRNAGLQGLGSQVNFVSRNIRKLYK